MMRFLLSAVLAAALMTDLAEAEFDAIGLGTLSCGRWTTERQDRKAFALEQWIFGFLSGVGFVGAPSETNPLNGTDAYAVLAWMDNYCRAHPLDRIMAAGGKFVLEHPH
jgi:hypothetical protein